jgi:methylase of polypeptide subunit release factors
VRNLHERHPEVATDNLDALAQTLLDEIIFIRFCEDRELTAFERLFDIARSKEVVDRFQALVQEYEELFDTRLFDPDLTTNIRPSPSVLQAIIAQSVEFYKFDVLDVDLLGRIYEEYLSYELQHGQQGLFYEFQLERRKQLGIYYTPSYIVEYLVGRALHVFEEANGRPVRSVLDPACGSGAFLTELFEELVRRQNEAVTFVQKRTLLEETIYGIDVDHYAIRRAAQALCYTALTGESALAGHHLLPALVGENLIAKDSLLDRDQLIPGQQFDVIVSNPPYRRVTGEELEQYRNLYQDVIFGQPDLYCMMLVAALDNLIEGGVVAFVVPDNLLRTHHYAPVRQYILNKARIVEISFLNYQAFESTNLQTVFIVLQRESSEEARKVSCIQVGYYSTPGVFERTAVDQIPQAGFYNPELDYAFNVQLTAPVRAVYEKIRDQSDMIEEHFNVSQGIKPNRETLYATPISESCEAYLFGKDIQPYSVNWSGSYIDYNLERAAEDPNVRLRDPDLFAVPVKLVMRKISGDRLVVAFDSKQYYADSSCYVLVPKGEVSQEIVYLMLALLNSRLTKFYYLVEYPDRKTIFPQIRVRDVNRLPFPNDDLLANETIVNSIVELVKSLRSDIASGQVSGSAAYQTSQAKQIERLLLNLYGLTEIDSALIDSYLEL